MSTPSPTSDTGSSYYSVYEGHANTLRTWLTAYGVGVPVLIFSQDKILDSLNKANILREVALCFLAGLTLQVLLAFVNKQTMWICYYGELRADFKLTRRYRCADWISEQFWIDIVFDVVTILLFAYPTYRALIGMATPLAK